MQNENAFECRSQAPSSQQFCTLMTLFSTFQMRRMGFREVNLYTVTGWKSSRARTFTWAAWLQSRLFCNIALSLEAMSKLWNKDWWPELLPRNSRIQVLSKRQDQRSLSEHSLASDPRREEACRLSYCDSKFYVSAWLSYGMSR